MSLKLTTTAFPAQGAIPDRYAKDGGNISPARFWSGVSRNAKSLALIVDDPDAPSGTFVHWVLYRIPPTLTGLDEHLPNEKSLPDGMLQGMNGFNEIGYGGPQPPSGTHRYFFRLYALGNEPDLAPGASRQDLDRAMQGHILEKSEIFGAYRHRKPGSQAA